MAAANAFAQFMVERINRFRLDPGGEFDRIVANAKTAAGFDPDVTAALRFFGVELKALRAELSAIDPAQPLAWNGKLAAAALGHSRLLVKADEQSHQVVSLGEPDLGARVRAEGYAPSRAGENVFAFAESATHAHDAFVVDWGLGAGGMQTGRGHRANLSLAGFAEVGIGVVGDVDPGTEVGPLVVTQNFGARAGHGPFLLGVAYRDRDGDRAYDMGEGTGGLTVKVAGRGQVSAAAAGGWALETGEGTMSITLSGKAAKGVIEAEIGLGRDNVKLDLVNGRHLLTSGDLDLVRGAASATVLGAGDVDLAGKNGADRLTGGDGRNRLSGEGGDDRLDGRGGADRLEGGAGDDVLKGGRGGDLFVFGAGDGTDRVTDWGKGDRVGLTGGLAAEDASFAASGADAILRLGATVVVIENMAGALDAGDLLVL